MKPDEYKCVIKTRTKPKILRAKKWSWRPKIVMIENFSGPVTKGTK